MNRRKFIGSAVAAVAGATVAGASKASTAEIGVPVFSDMHISDPVTKDAFAADWERKGILADIAKANAVPDYMLNRLRPYPSLFSSIDDLIVNGDKNVFVPPAPRCIGRTTIVERLIRQSILQGKKSLLIAPTQVQARKTFTRAWEELPIPQRPVFRYYGGGRGDPVDHRTVAAYDNPRDLTGFKPDLVVWDDASCYSNSGYDKDLCRWLLDIYSTHCIAKCRIVIFSNTPKSGRESDTMYAFAADVIGYGNLDWQILNL
jgi:hypothetical protein